MERFCRKCGKIVTEIEEREYGMCESCYKMRFS